jgi:2-keto-3-deoxy-L-rhamnonate aldolase RhmA
MIPELEKARKLKARLRQGEACYGAQIALMDPVVPEILGRAGFDWMVVDAEHAPHSSITIRAMLQAAVHTDAPLLARPLRLDPDQIRQYLDIGSPGVLCPFINTRQEAEILARACRYPPCGVRGYGPRRAGVFNFDADEYFQIANEGILCFPMIESTQALANIEDIVTVEGVDAVMIGPMDLSISLGIVGKFDDERYMAAEDKVRQACRKHGKIMGTACWSLEHAQKCAGLGDALLMVAGDDHFISNEARRTMSVLRPKT